MKTIFWGSYSFHNIPTKEKNDEKEYIMNLFDEINKKYGKKNLASSKTLLEEFLGRWGSSRKL